MRRILDVSAPIAAGQPVWPGDPPVSLERVADLAAGDAFNVSRLCLSTHTGTHLDPPAHFVEGGATVDEVPLEVLVGEALVADLSAGPGPITPAELDRAALRGRPERLVLKTAGRGLSPAGATRVVDAGVRVLGADAASIEAPGTSGYPAHVTLLAAGVPLVVGLDLSGITPGRYLLVCLPLPITGGDGAPARVVLIEP